MSTGMDKYSGWVCMGMSRIVGIDSSGNWVVCMIGVIWWICIGRVVLIIGDMLDNIYGCDWFGLDGVGGGWGCD